MSIQNVHSGSVNCQKGNLKDKIERQVCGGGVLWQCSIKNFYECTLGNSPVIQTKNKNVVFY